MILLLLLQALSEDRVRAEFEKLASTDVEVRQAAEAALVAMGEEAIPPLERMAATSDAETRGRVADVVRRLRWWDHTALWRGKKIDIRRGLAQASEFSAQARIVGSRIVDVTPEGARAVDLKSGRELWRAAPAIERGEHGYWVVEAGETSVVVRTLAGLSCIDAADGKVLWQRKGNWIRLAPCGADWVVAEAASVSRIGATGWTVKAEGHQGVAAAGPWVVAGGRVLDAQTGADRHVLEGQNVVRAVEAGPGRVILLTNRELSAFSTSDGARLWTRAGVNLATRLMVEGTRLYVADHMAMCCSIKLYALDVESGGVVWTAPAQGIPTEHSKYRHDARLARVGPHLVLMGEAAAGDYVEAFDPATGALVSRWTSR